MRYEKDFINVGKDKQFMLTWCNGLYVFIQARGFGRLIPKQSPAACSEGYPLFYVPRTILTPIYSKTVKKNILFCFDILLFLSIGTLFGQQYKL